MAGSTTKTKKKQTQSAVSAAYDNVPYISYPFAQTNPAMLHGIARIFGMEAVNPEKARILEIGCASGNNIIGIASIFPKSKCVGVDYSEKQIEEGQKNLKDYGLKNLELKHMSVMDINKEFGEFDYIICHGVLSWVPKDVQEKIMQICSENLSKDGIAYVSYNTLPGWNSVRSAREMMMYHTANFKEPAEKAVAAKQVLKFVGDAMRANNNPTASVMDRELEILNSQADYYLLHEHLEDENHQFYFHEFMDLAQKNDMQYLAETSLEKMFVGNFGEEVAKVLQTSNDIVRTEQYMDFIYDRRFRSTLLCHKDRILNRNVANDTIKNGYLLNRFTFPENFEAYDVNLKQKLQFVSGAGLVVTSDDVMIHCMMKVLQENIGQSVKSNDLVKAVLTQLKDNKLLLKEDKALLEARITEFLLRFLFIGGLFFYTSKNEAHPKVEEKPAANELCRKQAAKQPWIVNSRLEHVHIAPFDNFLIQLLDGTRDIPALAKQLEVAFEKDQLSMSEEGKKVTDMKVIKEKLPNFIDQALHRYARAAFLVENNA